MKCNYVFVIAMSMAAAPVFATPQDPMIYSNFEMSPALLAALEVEKTKACSTKPDSNVYQVACRDTLYMRGKRALNKNYNRTTKWLRAELKDELKDQQQRWLNNGSDECLLVGEGIEYPAKGRQGVEYEIEQLNCLLAEQKRRTNWLHNILGYAHPEFLKHPIVESVKTY